MQNLFCLAENIHQYSTVCRYKIYQVRCILFYVLGAPGANMSQNLTGLILGSTNMDIETFENPYLPDLSCLFLSVYQGAMECNNK